MDSPSVVHTFIVCIAGLDIWLPYPLPVMNKIILLPCVVVHSVWVPKPNIVTQMLNKSNVHTISCILGVYIIFGLTLAILFL
jgi:hypothetical protein